MWKPFHFVWMMSCAIYQHYTKATIAIALGVRKI